MVACPVTSIHASIGSLCVNSFGHLCVFYMRWQLKQIKCRDFPPPGCFVMVSFFFRGRYIFIFIPSPSFQQLQQLLSGNSTVLNPYFDAIIVTLYAGEWLILSLINSKTAVKKKGNAQKTDGTEQVYSYIFRKVHIRLYREVSEGFAVMTSLQCRFPAEA